MTAKCSFCRDERPANEITVAQTLLQKGFTGFLYEEIHYCTDKPKCVKFINKLVGSQHPTIHQTADKKITSDQRHEAWEAFLARGHG